MRRSAELELCAPPAFTQDVGKNDSTDATKLSDAQVSISFKSLLPQPLEQHQRYAVGQVERTSLRIEHRDPQPAVCMFLQQFLGQACSLTAKDEVIRGGKSGFGVELRAARLDEPQTRSGWLRLREDRPVRPPMPCHQPPIIHPRALEVRIIELESERFD